MRKLGWAIAAALGAAAGLTACETSPSPALTAADADQPPTHEWRVDDELLGELLVSAWRGAGGRYRLRVRGQWPIVNARTAQPLETATYVQVYRVYAVPTEGGGWRTVNTINLGKIEGRWRPDASFEFTTELSAQTLEHPEDIGFAHFCMGSEYAGCLPVNLTNTDDRTTPWADAAADETDEEPPTFASDGTLIRHELDGDGDVGHEGGHAPDP